MILKIAVESEEPIYRQLVEQLIVGIARGEIKPGEPLAPVRQLAQDLGINLHTVAKAYGVLRQEGYLVNNRQKGMTVALSPPPADEDFRQRIGAELAGPLAETVLRGMSREECLALCSEALDELVGGA